VCNYVIIVQDKNLCLVSNIRCAGLCWGREQFKLKCGSQEKFNSFVGLRETMKRIKCWLMTTVNETNVQKQELWYRPINIYFLYLLNQRSEYEVFYKLMCWLGLVCRLTSVMRSPPARRSRRPCYRSAGHRLFNLRMTPSRGRVWSSGFGCEASFVRCLILLSWMTSCTVGIPRSLWIVSLVTCHGASTIALSL
jgi:hypothetical protein